MGLDNMPKTLPCESEYGVDIDESPHGEHCNNMKDQGKCPWKIKMLNAGIPCYGMLGLDCWYRGKHGNFMLRKLASKGHTSPLDFYGDDVDGLNEQDCLDLAEWMAEHAEAYANAVSLEDGQLQDMIEEYRYAINWLKFVAPYGGSDVWY